ncbi:redoxin domain-containing protein [Gramella sp. BOM4]|nr:redoxin domain-containing protein [Christiangramia bathymodioli]
MNIQQISILLILVSVSQCCFGQTSDSLKAIRFERMQTNEFLKEEIYDFQGKELPEFELSLINGKKLNSRSLKGKPTLINFWFASCAPCIKKMPSLNKIKTEFSEEVNFIAITFHNKQEVASFLGKREFNFTHLVDSKEYLKKFGFFGYPKTLILDKNLIITQIEKRIPKDLQNEEKNISAFEERVRTTLRELSKT